MLQMLCTATRDSIETWPTAGLAVIVTQAAWAPVSFQIPQSLNLILELDFNPIQLVYVCTMTKELRSLHTSLLCIRDFAEEMFLYSRGVYEIFARGV